MAEILASKYRPRKFSDVVGQVPVVAVLRAMVKAGNPPPALLFRGSYGAGKTTCARVFAAALNCENPQDGDACTECQTCLSVREQVAPFVIEIDAASNGGVAEVRKIRDLCQFSHTGLWRVVVLDEAQAMSHEAFTALLKALEEPPPQTLFILVTTEPEKILTTVRSRTMPFDFHRLRDSDVHQRLSLISENEGIEASDAMLSAIVKYARGGLRDAIMLLDQVSRVGISTAEQFNEFLGVCDLALPFFWAAVRSDHAEGFKAVSEQLSRAGEADGLVSALTSLVSDLMILRSGGQVSGYSEQEIAEREELASLCDTESLVRVVEILWELRSRVRTIASTQQDNMEMAFSLISHALAGDQAPTRTLRRPVPVEASTDTPVSITELRASLS